MSGWNRFLFLFVGLASCTSTVQNAPLTGSVDLQGHRGARGLRPENTIVAFQECLKHGMNTIELDTTLTKDGQLIVHHDSSTNPSLCQTKKGAPIEKRRIRKMTVLELKDLDCGSKPNPRFPGQKLVPGEPLVTLNEFFEFVKRHDALHPDDPAVRFNIEIKVDEQFTQEELALSAKMMVKVVSDADMLDRTTVQSFRLEVLPMIRRLNSKLVTSALFEPTQWQGVRLSLGFSANSEELLEETERLGAKVVSPYHLYVSPSFIAQAHAKNIQVIPWTINDEGRMKELVEMGVDGIISDYPNKLKRIYRQIRAK